jgi:hypothetical protein
VRGEAEAGQGSVVKRGAMRRNTDLMDAIDLWRKLKTPVEDPFEGNLVVRPV